jgi:hypothetical protein
MKYQVNFLAKKIGGNNSAHESNHL